ncbi:ABC transporter permease [bacterium]|nr:ABC transporter permease [bacterium]MBU1652056.1 ABC transporter permease [bacterium]
MKLSNVFVVYNKEFLDVIRDRRTLFSMILLPIIVFPVMTLGLGGVIAGQMEKMEHRSSPVVVLGSSNSPEIIAALRQNDGLQIIDSIHDRGVAERMLADHAIQAVLLVPDHFNLDVETSDSETSKLSIWYDKSDAESELVERKLRRSLQDFRTTVVESALLERGIPVELLMPFEISSENQASSSQMAGAVLGMLLPYMVILLTMTGSTYSAIDMTAGEKERGTMETLLVCPASRLELVLGKFLTTMTAGMITAILAVVSMSVTVFAPGSMLMSGMAGEAQIAIDPMTIVVAFILLIPVAALIAAVLIAVAINARSYKEAQSYVYPIIILVIFPALASILPGVEADVRMAFIPLVNVSLILKNAFIGIFDWHLIGLAFFSSFVYAAFAIFIAVRIFQRESVLLRI